MKGYAESISEILYRHGVLSKTDIQSLKRDFKDSDPSQLNYFLLNEGLANKEELLLALSEYYEVPFFDVRGYQFNHELLELFPQNFLVTNAVIPIEFDGAILTVVAGNPAAPDLMEKIQQFTQHHIEFRVGITRDIVDEARAYYESPPKEIDIEEAEEEAEESTEDVTDLY